MQASVVFGVVTLCLALGARAEQPAGEDADRDGLKRLELVWNEAHRRGDAAALDALWADELVVTVPGMAPMSKADAMGVWRSGRFAFRSYDTSGVRVLLLGDVGVVIGRVVRVRESDGKEIKDDWLFTKVYVRRDGAWRVVAWHASPAPA